MEELNDEIHSLKLGKAGGYDGLTNEHLVYGGDTLVKHLCALFSRIIQLELVPREMTIGLILTILKPNKKDK